MKTAEELRCAYPSLIGVSDAIIAEIQLDAFKAGMTKAAEIVGDGHQFIQCGTAHIAIVRARDNLKPEDMK